MCLFGSPCIFFRSEWEGPTALAPSKLCTGNAFALLLLSFSGFKPTRLQLSCEVVKSSANKCKHDNRVDRVLSLLG
jgi:hypothetical protein